MDQTPIIYIVYGFIIADRSRKSKMLPVTAPKRGECRNVQLKLQKNPAGNRKCTEEQGNGKNTGALRRKRTILKKVNTCGNKWKRLLFSLESRKRMDKLYKNNKKGREFSTYFVRSDSVAVFGEKIAKCG